MRQSHFVFVSSTLVCLLICRAAMAAEPATPTAQEVKSAESQAALDVRESASPDEHRIPIELTDPYHKPHLDNFFNAIRGAAKLNCPPEIGYETAVTVLKVNEAIEANQRLSFNPEDFKI